MKGFRRHSGWRHGLSMGVATASDRQPHMRDDVDNVNFLITGANSVVRARSRSGQCTGSTVRPDKLRTWDDRCILGFGSDPRSRLMDGSPSNFLNRLTVMLDSSLVADFKRSGLMRSVHPDEMLAEEK